ncbi:MAG: hypothetical protein E6417_24825, partial [Bradyrhizobium sp.]|nr:hypothetical protein [Bradyrhizobium sp.]
SGNLPGPFFCALLVPGGVRFNLGGFAGMRHSGATGLEPLERWHKAYKDGSSAIDKAKAHWEDT